MQKSPSLYFLVFLSFLLWLAAPARADSYITSIKQADKQADSPNNAYSQICDDSAPVCSLSMPITLANQENISVQAHISFQPGGANFRFEGNGSYFSTSGYGNDILYIPLGNTGSPTYKAALYLPHSLAQSDSIDSLHRLPVQRVPNKKVAELEITIVRNKIQPAPSRAESPL